MANAFSEILVAKSWSVNISAVFVQSALKHCTSATRTTDVQQTTRPNNKGKERKKGEMQHLPNKISNNP